MAELALAPEKIIALRASAHQLDPVVLMGAAGLSAAVIREIDRALRAHGLVKVRGGKSERAERDAMFREMAETLEAARVQVIGNTFVLFRPIPVEAPLARESRPTARKTAKRSAAKDPAGSAGKSLRAAPGKAGAIVKRGVIRGAAPRSAGPAGFGARTRAGAPAPARRRTPVGGTRQR